MSFKAEICCKELEDLKSKERDPEPDCSHAYATDLTVHKNNATCPEHVRRHFIDGETSITDDQLKDRRKKALLDSLFLHKLSNMKKGVDGYLEEKEEEAQRIASEISSRRRINMMSHRSAMKLSSRGQTISSRTIEEINRDHHKSDANLPTVQKQDPLQAVKDKLENKPYQIIQKERERQE